VYAAADETQGAVAWGVARTALPDTVLPFQTDTTSKLHLTMVSGSLASVSSLEMLNGANLVALVRADGNAEPFGFLRPWKAISNPASARAPKARSRRCSCPTGEA
jgi:hypothetical protein